jgi:hypothetical protein
MVEPEGIWRTHFLTATVQIWLSVSQEMGEEMRGDSISWSVIPKNLTSIPDKEFGLVSQKTAKASNSQK